MNYCQYRKKDNVVVSVSDGQNQVSELGQVQVTLLQKQQILDPENDARIIKGKLVITKRPEVLDKEKTQETIDKIKKGEHTNEELAELLKQLTK